MTTNVPGADGNLEAEKRDPGWEDLEQRCASAKLTCTVSTLGPTDILIGLVGLAEAGSNRPSLLVWKKTLEDVLEIEFEKFRLVDGYHGICSPNEETVEAFLEPAIASGPVKGIIGQAGPREAAGSEVVHLESQGVSIRLGPPSRELLALAGDDGAESRGVEGTSIRISGVSVSGANAGRAALERVADAVLFQFDTKFQQPIVLSRLRQFRFPFPLGGEGGDLAFPVSEFDREPMSLYWYGRGAHGLPLLEFFAYYQVLEFYYDHYVDAEGRRRLAQVLKDPSFSPHNDRQLGRVLRAAGRGSTNRRTERDQLLTTIRGCADAAAIRSFIEEDDERKKFFEEQDPKLTQKVIKTGISDNELLQQIADRIYDLRCKIVHTKEGGGNDGVELLLPHSPEADRLHQDIDLLRLIARQALIAASRPLAKGGRGA